MKCGTCGEEYGEQRPAAEPYCVKCDTWTRPGKPVSTEARIKYLEHQVAALIETCGLLVKQSGHFIDLFRELTQ